MNVKTSKKKEKVRNVSITVSNAELDALEDSLVAWNLCKKHKALAWTPEHRQKSEQEIFKMQDECEECQRYNGRLHKRAWKVLSRLFEAYDVEPKKNAKKHNKTKNYSDKVGRQLLNSNRLAKMDRKRITFRVGREFTRLDADLEIRRSQNDNIVAILDQPPQLSEKTTKAVKNLRDGFD